MLGYTRSTKGKRMKKRSAGLFAAFMTAVVVSAALWGGALAQEEEPQTLRVGLQAAGTFSWVVFAIDYFGVDDELGIQLESATYASKQATELALRAGEVDVVVDDFIGAVQMRSRGLPVRAVYPYSLATGALVVAADSPVAGVGDLEGRTLAAASLDDKSLLILRALAIERYGFDLQERGNVIAAAPPLMQELLANGEIEAALPYWHFVAQMVNSGEFRELISVQQMLTALDLSSELPILVMVASEEADPEAVSKLITAYTQAAERMKTDDAFWQAVLDEQLYSLNDESLFPAVRAAWEAGLPERWDEEIIGGLERLVEELVAVAGGELVGVERLDTDAFTTVYLP